MLPFNDILLDAKERGIEVKTFCTWCTNAADGDLVMDDGNGNDISVPTCAGCLEIIQKRYSNKFDN